MKLKLRICSDIHTEFYAKDLHKIPKIALEILPELKDDPETVLVLAGDIGSMHKPMCLKAFLDAVAPRFKKVLYTKGNHEAYGGSLRTVDEKIQALVPENVLFIPQGSFEIEGQRFHLTTLWTDFDGQNPVSMWNAGRMMNDYRVVEGFIEGYNATPEDSLALHLKAMKFLEESVDEGDVIVTHHAPSFQSVDTRFKSSDLNGAYASNLEQFILDRKPKLHIHGHMHSPKDYFIGSTRIICNPRGYVHHGEGDEYNPRLVVEI